MRRFIASGFFLILFPALLSAQQYPTDSIISRIALMENNIAKVDALNSLTLLLKEEDPERAIYYGKQALSLANQLKSIESCAVTNKIVAGLYESRHNFQPCINYYLISVKHYDKLGNDLELARLYNQLGSIYIHNHFDFDQGLAYFNKALAHAVPKDYKEEIAKAYRNIGGFFYDQQQYEQAGDYFQKAFDIYQKSENTNELAGSLNDLGKINLIRGNLSLAHSYTNRAIQINEKAGNASDLAMNYESLAQIYSAENDAASAKTYYLKSKELYISINNPEGLISVYRHLGNHYLRFGEFDSAIGAYNEMKSNALNFNALEGVRDANIGLSQAYENAGNTKKSLDYFKQYTQYKDSIFNISKSEQLGELQTRFGLDIKEKELELKDNEIALLQREQKLIKFRQLLLILSLALILILSILIYGRLQQRNKKSQFLLTQKEALSKAKQEIMEAELKNKNSELVNFAIHLVEKNKFLEEMKSELKKIRSVQDDERENRLKELSLNVQKNIKLQKDLEEFQRNVDHAHQEFFTKLKLQFPDLTKNEERLCAMLRLNLSSKEIAALNNISVRAIEMGRYRLRKKFKIANEITLSDFLKEI
ncbi:MAG: tetratricopeptide repeat protein [Bacteroidetes bacterium]|nr:tetratricopeptide repeat protein [Bacteroidota bacterium]